MATTSTPRIGAQTIGLLTALHRETRKRVRAERWSWSPVLLSRIARVIGEMVTAPTAMATETLTEDPLPYTAGRSGMPMAAAFGNARVSDRTELSAAVSLPSRRAEKYMRV